MQSNHLKCYNVPATGGEMERPQHENQLHLLKEAADSPEILAKLLQLSQQPSPPRFQLHNSYKEVPVAANAEILYLFDDALCCRTTEIQSRAIELSRHTILKCPELPHDVYAEARYNPESHEVCLSGFSYVDVLSERRNTIRVKIGGLLYVGVEAGPDQFRAKLKDLSLGGCALEIPDKALLGSFTYFYLNLTLSLANRPAPVTLRVMSRLLRFEGQSGAPCRGIFLFELDRGSEDLIGMYIAQRQGEIIRELKV